MPFRLTTRKRTETDRLAENVFRRIEMCGGDRTQCWPWKGFFRDGPITRINNTLFYVHRIVYGLKKGIPYDQVPKLTWVCGNNRCCNPDHIVPQKGSMHGKASTGSEAIGREPSAVHVVNGK